MKIAILGATGNIGRELLDQALAAGHEVVAYTRDASAIPPRAHLIVVQGNLEDTSKLTAALTDADVLVCSIAPRIKMIEARKRTDFMQTLLPSVLKAASSGDTRLVLVSAFGVGDSTAKASGFARIIYRTLTKGLFEDKRLSEVDLTSSGLDWTVALPVNLKAGKATNQAETIDLDSVRKVPGLPTLPFADAAAALLRIASDPSWNGRHVLVTTERGWLGQG